MKTIHPLFHSALRAITPVSKSVRPYAVTLRMLDKIETVNILAFTSCDAITRVIDIYFDGEDNMPIDGLAIDARPMNILRNAA